MSFLKLIDAGVPKEKLGLLAVPLTPLQIILPFYISKKLSQMNPFSLYTQAFVFRVGLLLLNGTWAYFTPVMQNSDSSYPTYYYMACLILEAMHSVAIYATYIPMSIFFSKITDKKIGATYITFLNTVSNLGTNERT